MSEVVFKRQGETIEFTAASAYTAGQCELIAGLAAFAVNTVAIGEIAVFQILGLVKAVASGTEPAGSRGNLVFWDSSANKATLKPVAASGDFVLGTLAKASAANATTFEVLLNTFPNDTAAGLLAGKAIDTKTDNYTADAQDTGKVLVMNAADKAVTLPATSAGLELVVMCTSVGDALNISPNASDKIMGPDVAGVDDKDYILAAAALGDYLVLVGDGSAGWYVKASRGTWTQEA